MPVTGKYMKALIAMSGGVDSSVAALLMKNEGYECTGCTMKLYENDTVCNYKKATCCSLKDVEDARNVAYRLSMPYYVFNFTGDFKEKIIDKFIGCYEKGITPNPCIDCNRYMKFEKLYERAVLMDCDVIVTGHYATVEEKDGEYFLKKSVDASKDQSYVLYSLTQEQLKHTRFPLGSLTKAEVRKIADENGFINAAKPDSQDICFVPDGDYSASIEKLAGKKYPPGDFILKDGTVIGKHKGIIHYTIGQRKGLGIAAEHPYYVVAIDAEKNTVTLGDNEDLFTTTFYVKHLNWISGKAPEGEFRCNAKIRYRHAEKPASAFLIAEDTLKVVFDEPQRAVTPGQSAVLYDNDYVIGGGEIVSKP